MVNYWKISPGEEAYRWKEFREENWISLGWCKDIDWRNTNFGDLAKNPNKESLKKVLREHYSNKETSNRQIAARAAIIHRFLEIKPGDKVIAYDKNMRINAMGEVNKEYDFKINLGYPHIKSVKWQKIFGSDDENESLDIRPIKKRLKTKIWLPPAIIEMKREDWDIILDYATSPRL